MGIGKAMMGAIRTEEYLNRVKKAHELDKEGYSIEEIANAFGVSETTVNRYFKDWSAEGINEQIKTIEKENKLVWAFILTPFILFFIGLFVLFIIFS